MPSFSSLNQLALLLGIGYLVVQMHGIVRTGDHARMLRQFPRSLSWGYPLVGLATLWFLSAVNQSQKEISDFAAYTTVMLLGFTLLGLGTCLFLKDFLAARGYAVLLLLAAKCMVDTARWNESDWRLVIVIWAYVWVLHGMWYSVSPWRLRDRIGWMTASEPRLRILCICRGALALVVILLGIFVY